MSYASTRGRDGTSADRVIQKLSATKPDAETKRLMDSGLVTFAGLAVKEAERQMKRHHSKHQQRVKESESKLLDEVLESEQRRMAAKAKWEAEQAAEEELQRARAPEQRQKKTEEYVRSRIGRDLIDMTGHSPDLQPSQVTKLKTHAFGLGKSDPSVLAAAAKKYPEVTFNSEFVPKIVDRPRSSVEPWMEDSDDDGEQEASAHREPHPDPTGPVEQAATVKRLQTRQLSMFEERKMQEAKERQQQRLSQGQPKTVLGKQYQSSKFLCQPEEVVFTDFVVGQSYSQKFTIVNVSFTFNTFKILPLPDSIQNFFDIRYTPCGRMSAGVSCVVSITFRPETNADINSAIPVLAETGPFSIPLRCSTRKAAPQLSSSALEFGHVIFGESATQIVTVGNGGALPVPFFVTLSDPSSESAGWWRLPTGPLTLPAYGSTRVAIKCEPPLPADAAVRSQEVPASGALRFVFGRPSDAEEDTQRQEAQEASGALQWTGQREAAVQLSAVGSPIPLYLPTPVADFQCILYGKTYRTRVEVTNRSSSRAFKLLVPVPRELQPFLEITPNVGFIQKADQFSLLVRLLPTEGIQSAVAAYNKRVLGQFPSTEDVEAQGVLQFCIPVSTPDSDWPVFFTVRAVLAEGNIGIDPPAIDFGECYVGQSVARALSLSNHSPLVQKLLFAALKQTVRVEPDQGCASLLPNSSELRHVIFSPSAAAPVSFSLTLKSGNGQEVFIPCRGVGVDPPLLLGSSSLCLPSVFDGESASARLTVTNPSKSRPFAFWFRAPSAESTRVQIALEEDGGDTPSPSMPTDDASPDLTFSPPTGVLEPLQSVEVQVRFSPRLTERTEAAEKQRLQKQLEAEKAREAAAQAAEEAAAKDKKKGKKAEKADPKATDDKKDPAAEPPSALAETPEAAPTPAPVPTEFSCPADRFAAWSLSDSTVAYCREGGQWSRIGSHRVPLFACPVSALPAPGSVPAHQPVSGSLAPLFVEVRTAMVPSPLEANPRRVDFAECPVGSTKPSSLSLRNIGDHPLTITAAPLPESCSFGCLTPQLRLEPMQTGQLSLEFSPSKPSAVYDRLELNLINEQQGTKFTMTVPLLGRGIVPSVQLDVPEGRLDIGCALLNEEITKKFKLTNGGSHPFSFDCSDSRPLLASNLSGRSPFHLVPPQATVPPGGSLELTCCFRPDTERSFKDVVSIGPVKLTLVGRGSSAPLLLWSEDAKSEPTDPLAVEAAKSIALTLSPQAQPPAPASDAQLPPTQDRAVWQTRLKVFSASASEASKVVAGSFQLTVTGSSPSAAKSSLVVVEPASGNVPANGAVEVLLKTTSSLSRDELQAQIKRLRVVCALTAGARSSSVAVSLRV